MRPPIPALALPLVALAGCLLLDSDKIAITYDVEPQQFQQDFGTASGNLQDVPCAANPSICSTVQAPAGTSAACESGKCALTAELRFRQGVTLASQKSFPSQVANSSVVSQVAVNRVRYWLNTNTLTFATPPLAVYVGPQTAQRETDPGVSRLGTMPAIAAGARTCTADKPCEMDLTPEGKGVLGTFARDYKTPFSILVAGKITVSGGQPMPAGRIDMSLQPQLEFSIPLK